MIALITYQDAKTDQDAKTANSALNIRAVANPYDVVYLRGENNENVLLRTGKTDFVSVFEASAVQTQLCQVSAVTTATGDPTNPSINATSAERPGINVSSNGGQG